MGLFSWIIVGGLSGWIASKIMDTKDNMGCITNIFVGIIGAFIGGFIVSLIGGTGVTGFNLRSMVVAVIGSVVFIWVVKMLRK